MNRVEMTGRIATEIDLRKTQSNKSVTEFSLAVETGKKDQAGNRIAEFFRVVAWEASAEFLANYAGKGALIAVEGRVKADSYTDQYNQKRTKVYILAEHVEILNRPKPKPQSNDYQQKLDLTPSDTMYNNVQERQVQERQAVDNINIENDELPFY